MLQLKIDIFGRKIEVMIELRKMNYEDIVEQWKYVTALPTNENGLTNQYEGISFDEYRDTCRFNGCSHTHEPGCGVKEAIEEGKISKERYENYKLIYDELKNRKKY